METKEKIKKLFNDLYHKGGKLITFLLVFGLGYFSSEIYHIIKTPTTETSSAPAPKLTKKIGKVSVAINERNELMIIDRADGSYEIYQDSVGRCIFNLYANSIQSKYENQ